MVKYCERCGSSKLNPEPYTARLINTGVCFEGRFRTTLVLCPRCQEELTDWVNGVNMRKETDVDKRRCPGCGSGGGWGEDSGIEYHGAQIYNCYNGECRVHEYLVYGEDVEEKVDITPGKVTKVMSDDEAMLSLIYAVDRLNTRTTRMSRRMSLDPEEMVDLHRDQVNDRLDTLKKHYRR